MHVRSASNQLEIFSECLHYGCDWQPSYMPFTQPHHPVLQIVSAIRWVEEPSQGEGRWVDAVKAGT